MTEMQNNMEVLKSFDINSLPALDVAVLGALELFQERPIPKIDMSLYKHPLVVGSGGAEATARIVFEKTDAVFASENDFEDKIKNVPTIDSIVIVSASGSKHAPILAQIAKDLGKRVMLITSTPNSQANQVMAGYNSFDEYVLPKNREPYTYNTSTYMGMILGMTGENPAEIYDFINNTIATLSLPDYSKYKKYYIMVPPKFLGICRLLNLKFIELFGRNIARDVETIEYTRLHATNVVPAEGELFISFGMKDENWGSPENRLFIPLPEGADYGAMMAVGYYSVGKIQNAHKHYFDDNIEAYTRKVSEMTGANIKPIVEV